MDVSDTSYLGYGDIVQVKSKESWSRKCKELCGQDFICMVLHQSDGDIAPTCYRVIPVTEEVRKLCADHKLNGVNGAEDGAFDIYYGYLDLIEIAEPWFSETDFESLLED